MISINATLVAQMIHFLILLFILNRLMLQPLLKLMAQREKFTEKTKDEIEDFEIKIGQLRDNVVEKEMQARKDASQEKTKMMEGGMTEAEGFLNLSREEVSAIRKQSDNEIDAELKKTQPLLPDQAASLVDGITSKIIGRRVKA